MRHTPKNTISKATNSSVVFLWFATMTGNLFNWLFSLILNRHLTLTDFSTLSLFLNLQLIISLVALAIQMSATKFSANSKSKTLTPNSNNLFHFSILVGIILTTLFAFMHTWCQNFFHINLNFIFYLSVISFIFYFMLLGFVRGTLAGWQLLSSFALLLLIETATKLIFSILGLYLNYPLQFALLSLPLSMLVALISGLFIFKKHSNQKLISSPKSANFKSILPFLTQALGLTLSVRVLVYLDMPLVKHFFPPEQAGIYATLSLVGKIIFFLSTGFIGILVPLLAHQQAHQESSKKLIIITMLLTGSISLITSIMFIFFPRYSLHPMLTAQKASLIRPYLTPYMLAITLLSLIVTYATYSLFTQKKYFLYFILISIVCLIFLMSLFHQTLSQITAIILIVSIFLFMSLLGLSRFQKLFSKNFSHSRS